jgi:diguanylate cyclase (GGDEF)-like protein
MTRTLAPLGLQAALLTLCAIGSRTLAVPKGWREPFRLLPFLIVAGGLVLAWRFGRGRVFLALGLVGALGLVLRRSPPGAVQALDAAASVLVLVALAVLALLPERPLLGLSGLTRTALIVMPALALVWLQRSRPETLEQALAWQPLPLLSRPVLAALLVAAAASLTSLVRRRLPIEAGFLGAAMACFLALGSSARESRSFFLIAAALALVVALMEDVYGKAYLDELTGLPGRRALTERLENLGGRYVIAMLDVDHFKRLNDRYGHDVGDQALRMLGSKLRKLRGGGRAYRFGGEEFALVFPGRDLAETQPVLESLRQQVAEAEFLLRGKDRPKRKPRGKRRRAPASRRLALTVSIGVAARTPRLATPDSVLEAADKALYRAKRKGRNRLSK